MDLERIMDFLKRYPKIRDQKTQPLQKARAQCPTTESFTKFFSMLGNTTNRLNIKNPAQIINLDETEYNSTIETTVLAALDVSHKSKGDQEKKHSLIIEIMSAN